MANLGIFTHIQKYLEINQAYSGQFVKLAYWEPEAYSEPWHNGEPEAYLEPWYIKNQKHVQNPGTFRSLAYSLPQHNENPGIFRTLTCWEPEAYLNICEITTTKHFSKTVHKDNHFHNISFSPAVLNEIWPF